MIPEIYADRRSNIYRRMSGQVKLKVKGSRHTDSTEMSRKPNPQTEGENITTRIFRNYVQNRKR
jgi:hypothetical protein